MVDKSCVAPTAAVLSCKVAKTMSLPMAQGQVMEMEMTATMARAMAWAMARAMARVMGLSMAVRMSLVSSRRCKEKGRWAWIWGRG